jgi:hypothetical protein
VRCRVHVVARQFGTPSSGSGRKVADTSAHLSVLHPVITFPCAGLRGIIHRVRPGVVTSPLPAVQSRTWTGPEGHGNKAFYLARGAVPWAHDLFTVCLYNALGMHLAWVCGLPCYSPPRMCTALGRPTLVLNLTSACQRPFL